MASGSEFVKLMNKKIKQEKLHYERQLRNLKPIVMEEALDWLKREGENVTKFMTH